MKRVMTALAVALCLCSAAPAFAACSDPAGEAGEIIFNRDYRAMEYCDGTNWISMGKEASVLHGQKTLGGGYQPNAVNFDGTNDYLTLGSTLTGAVDSKMVTGSFWIKPVGGLDQRVGYFGSFNIRKGSTTNVMRFSASNDSDTQILDITAGNYTTNVWQHVLFSFDLSNPANRHVYVDGVARTIGGVGLYTDDLINFTDLATIGGDLVGNNKIDGDIADLWIDTGTYIDLSDPAERAKFYNNGPVYLGANGELPTGSAPEIFLSGDVDDWHTNKGAGGGFTENGALTASTTNPPATAEKKMIGWWKLDEQTGTTAADSSGNGLDGSMQNGLDAATDSIVSPTGRGLDFNGVNARVSVPHQPHLNPTDNNMTIAFWVNPSVDWNDLPDAVWRLIDKSASNTGWQLHVSGFNAENMRLTVGYGSSSSNVQLYGSGWDANRWYHIAVTINGDDNSVRMYRDGVLLGTNTTGLTGPIAHNTQPLLIGDGQFNDDLDGYMADVRFYNYPLSAAEIAELYAASDEAYQPNAVAFDGTNDYLTRGADLTGNADSKMVTGSFWYRTNSLGVNQRLLFVEGSSFEIVHGTLNQIRFTAQNSASAAILNMGTPSFNDTNWKHVMFSFDLSDPAKRHIYVNDASNIASASTYTDDVIDFTRLDYHIGASVLGANKLNGDIADFWMDIGTYIDLSIEENRRKFISAAGEAVFLGNNGELVTGDPPDIFLSGDTATWHTNKGTGGGFSEVGALTNATTEPPGGASIIPRYCTNPVQPAGTLIFNTSENVMQYCDGYRHIPLSSPGLGAGGCIIPSGLAGELVFNTSVNSLQYCDGSGWVGVGPYKEDTSTCSLGTWVAQPAVEANNWTSVTYGNGLFVAVASSGTNRVMTSPDGVTWTPRTAAAANPWTSVTYGNGLFVAVASSGTNRVMTSPDGVTWTPRTAAAANPWKSVTYGNGQFAAVTFFGTNRVMTSPDGVTWTPRTAAANPWNSVTYGNGQFVAVATSGTNPVMSSSNGVTWTGQTADPANFWQYVTYGNNQFVAVSQLGTNRVMTSPNGITWTQQVAAEANNWTSVTYGNGLFVAVASSGANRVMTSPDGVTWTPRTAAAANPWNSVTYGNGKFVAVANIGTNRVMTASCN